MRGKDAADRKLGQICVSGEPEQPNEPEPRAGVGANLTEFWNGPMMPTLDPTEGKANRGPEGNRYGSYAGSSFRSGD
jgi:hypothetical protein